MGLKFKRQVPIGPYIVDFLCQERQLIVELDGGQHSEQIAYDARRTAFLQQQGFNVLRYWNPQVLSDCQAVLAHIALNLD